MHEEWFRKAIDGDKLGLIGKTAVETKWGIHLTDETRGPGEISTAVLLS